MDPFIARCVFCNRATTYRDEADALLDGWDTGDEDGDYHVCESCQSPRHVRMSREKMEARRRERERA